MVISLVYEMDIHIQEFSSSFDFREVINLALTIIDEFIYLILHVEKLSYFSSKIKTG